MQAGRVAMSLKKIINFYIYVCAIMFLSHYVVLNGKDNFLIDAYEKEQHLSFVELVDQFFVQSEKINKKLQILDAIFDEDIFEGDDNNNVIIQLYEHATSVLKQGYFLLDIAKDRQLHSKKYKRIH